MTLGRFFRWIAPMTGAVLVLAGCPGSFPPGDPAYQCPVAGQVSFINDWHFPRSGGRLHEGLDMFAPIGRPTLAVTNGRINRVWTGTTSGLSIDLRGDDGKQYNYFHLSAEHVSVGQRVNTGAHIGDVGDSGNAKGGQPHLHFEIRVGGTPQPPYNFAKAECDGTAQPGGSAPPPYSAKARGMAHTPSGQGYWVVGRDGGVFAFGDAQFKGSLPGVGVNVSNIVGIAPTPSGGGYWLVGSDGGVFSFGNAPFKGSLGGLGITNVVGIASTKSGNGYWLVARDGGVFSFGDAQFHGSIPGLDVNNPKNTMGIAATKSGNGYYLVQADGGVFAFGDARYDGSVPGLGINTNKVTGIAIDKRDGRGYWLVANDGAVYSFQAPFHGRVSGLNEPAMGITSTPDPAGAPDGRGYWIWAGDGGVFTLGDAPFKGSAVGLVR